MALVLDGDNGIVGVLATNADGDVIIDTNTFFVDAVTNRVGIGSITPENTLHVVSGDDQQILVQNSATGDASIKFNRSGQTFFIGIESSDNSFRISDGGVGLGTDDRLVIDSSGNVGINTTAPRARLDVSGNMIVGDRYDQGNLESEWPASGSQLHVSRIGYPDAGGILVADGNEANIIVSTGPSNTAGGGAQGWLGSLWFGSSDSPLVSEQFNWKVAGVRSYSSRDTAASNVSSGNLSFWTTDNTNSAAERLTINYNGNVGIGSTNPNTLLDINATSGGNGGPGTTSMTGMSVGAGFVAFRNNGSTFNEAIRGESNCMGIYNYNYNDGVLIYTNNADSNVTPSFHPAYHFGGYNNADMETFGRGWANGDPIFTMARPGSKSTGSGYGAKGVSNSSQFTSIVKTATATEFRDNQGQHYFDGHITAGQSVRGESTSDAGFHYRSGNGGNGYRSFVHHDGQTIFRDTGDYNHKMWYYDGVNISTNQSHGHFRVYGDNNTSRNATTGGNTIRFSVDTPNGNIGVTEGGSQIYSGSDARLKTNVVDLDNQLEKIKQLRPVSFDWKYTAEEEYIYGFIAQEVQAVDPTVTYDMGTTHYRVDKQYGEDLEPDGTIENTLAIYERQLIPMMVKAMQEMSDKIDSLQARLDDAGL